MGKGPWTPASLHPDSVLSESSGDTQTLSVLTLIHWWPGRGGQGASVDTSVLSWLWEEEGGGQPRLIRDREMDCVPSTQQASAASSLRIHSSSSEALSNLLKVTQLGRLQPELNELRRVR